MPRHSPFLLSGCYFGHCSFSVVVVSRFGAGKPHLKTVQVETRFPTLTPLWDWVQHAAQSKHMLSHQEPLSHAPRFRLTRSWNPDSLSRGMWPLPAPSESHRGSAKRLPVSQEFGAIIFFPSPEMSRSHFASRAAICNFWRWWAAVRKCLTR